MARPTEFPPSESIPLSKSPEKKKNNVEPCADAVCFTAGLQGVAFAAGTTHAHMAADRAAPAVIAGVSTGALNAAVMQRCYQDLTESREEQSGSLAIEASRWKFLRRYVTKLSYSPNSVLWDAIPNHTDIFAADQAPLNDLGISDSLREPQKEAEKRKITIDNFFEWITSLPVRVSLLADTTVAYVRWKEKGASPARFTNCLRFILIGLPLLLRVCLHAIADRIHHPMKGVFRRTAVLALLGVTLFYLLPVFLTSLPMEWLLLRHFYLRAAMVMAVIAIAMIYLRPLNRVRQSWILTLAYLLPIFFLSLVEMWGFARYQHLAAVVMWIAASFSFLLSAVMLTQWQFKKGRRPSYFLDPLLSDLGMKTGLITNFYLRNELTDLFGAPSIVDQKPMPVVLVAAPLEILKVKGAPAPTFLLSANTGANLVDALCTAMAIPGLLPAKCLDSAKGNEANDWWPDKQHDLGHPPAKLHLVDGAAVRQNPLPALIDYLKRNPEIAEKVAAKPGSREKEPKASIHIIYSVPLSGPKQAVCPLPDKDANIVDVAFTSLRLARRRDTQMEVEQMEAISKLQAEIDLFSERGQVDEQQGTPKTLKLFADEISPERDSPFDNSLNPSHDAVMKQVAEGCRRTLQVLYREELQGRGQVSCPAFIRQVAPHREQFTPGLPEVCQHCCALLEAPPPKIERSPQLDIGRCPELKVLECNLQSYPRLVFLASGGVFRGAFHIGMLAALWQGRMKPDLIVGASVGTLMGAVLGAMFTRKAKALELLGTLTKAFDRVDSQIALTNTLKGAAREIGVRARKIHISPAEITKKIKQGGKLDPGFAALGAPPQLVDALSDFFSIPRQDVAKIAAKFVAGEVAEETNTFLKAIKEKTLPQLKIQYAIVGSALLELRARDLLKDVENAACQAQPFEGIAFYGTVTNMGGKHPELMLGDYSKYSRPFDFVEAALASSAFPAIFASRRESEIFPGIGRTDVRFADGGMFDNLPFIHAIEALGDAQLRARNALGRHYDRSASLRERAKKPDLFIAGSLNAPPELEELNGPASPVFDTLTSIWKRAKRLQDNGKIRSFENSSRTLHAQLEQLAKLHKPGSLIAADPDFLDSFVNTAVMPVFPADADHLNGTFQFCESLFLDRDKVLRSIADGCYQTMKTVAEAQAGKNGVSLHVRASMQALMRKNRNNTADKIGSIEMGENRSIEKGECPFFKIDGGRFKCPFAAASTNSVYPRSEQVYEFCKNDPAHKVRERQRAVAADIVEGVQQAA
jgi:predicted acylesterase/phospholipase RssA